MRLTLSCEIEQPDVFKGSPKGKDQNFARVVIRDGVDAGPVAGSQVHYATRTKRRFAGLKRRSGSSARHLMK